MVTTAGTGICFACIYSQGLLAPLTETDLSNNDCPVDFTHPVLSICVHLCSIKMLLLLGNIRHGKSNAFVCACVGEGDL